MEGTLLLQQAEVEDAGDWDRVEIEAGHILYFIHKYLLSFIYFIHIRIHIHIHIHILYFINLLVHIAALRVKWKGKAVVMDDGGAVGCLLCNQHPTLLAWMISATICRANSSAIQYYLVLS